MVQTFLGPEAYDGCSAWVSDSAQPPPAPGVLTGSVDATLNGNPGYYTGATLSLGSGGIKNVGSSNVNVGRVVLTMTDPGGSDHDVTCDFAGTSTPMVNFPIAPGESWGCDASFVPGQVGTWGWTLNWQGQDGTWHRNHDLYFGGTVDIGAPPTATTLVGDQNGALSADPGFFTGATLTLTSGGVRNYGTSPVNVGKVVLTMTDPDGFDHDTTCLFDGTSTPMVNFTIAPGASYECRGSFVPDKAGTWNWTFNWQETDGAWHRQNELYSSAPLEITDPPVKVSAFAYFVNRLPETQLGGNVHLRWVADDEGGPGINHFQIRQQTSWRGQDFGPWTIQGKWRTIFDPGSGTTPIARGDTMCFSVRAIDAAGDIGAWSTPTCTSRPFSSWNLGRSPGWQLLTGTQFYGRRAFATTRKGARFIEENVSARHIEIVATRCPGCGTLGIWLGRRQLGTVSLNAARTMHHVLIDVPGAPRLITSARLTIRVMTSGRRVVFEGASISRLAHNPCSSLLAARAKGC